MSRLEEKLFDLGYQRVDCDDYVKITNFRFVYIFVILNKQKTNIINYGIQTPNNIFRNQYQIDNLQQAFNQLQSDLEIILKECE